MQKSAGHIEMCETGRSVSQAGRNARSQGSHAIIAESEEWATRAGGWTSTRHFNHPTIDIPLAELPRTRAFLNADALPSRIYPLLGHAFESTLPNWRALRVADAVRAKP